MGSCFLLAAALLPIDQAHALSWTDSARFHLRSDDYRSFDADPAVNRLENSQDARDGLHAGTTGGAFNVITNYHRPISSHKSPWVALGYAVIPGYFIPSAFGHLYAESYLKGSVISASRLAGRIMWMHAFFDNVFIRDARGDIGQNILFYTGMALDLGGYLYDIIRSPLEVAQYDRNVIQAQGRLTPFINIAYGGPCCGVKFLF